MRPSAPTSDARAHAVPSSAAGLPSAVPPPPALPPPAFLEVYDANVDFVWRVVASLGVRPSSVEDVTQEIFLVVNRKLPEFAGLSSIRTWLYQIARRVVHDHRRTLQRREAPVDRSAEPVDVESLSDSDDAAPDALAARAEAVRLLDAVLEDLDDEKREVFVLAELEELPAPQIAEAIGINVNTVYSRLRHARAAFNQALARHQARTRTSPHAPLPRTQTTRPR